MSTRCALLICAALVTAPIPAAEERSSAHALAEQFGRDFLAGEHAANTTRMTAEMQGAFGETGAAAALSQLSAQVGSVREIGPAWQEDVLDGFRRFRIPVTFERASFDLRVVLDQESKVAGFFVVPQEPEPSTDGEPQRDEGMPGREIELRIGDADRGLGATLTLPTGDGPFPGVVLVHGSGPNDRDETIGPNKPFLELARGLAARGVATLRYDKRSHAYPMELVQLGEALTVEHVVIADARIALSVLEKRPEIAPGGVHLLGHSLGGHLLGRIVAEGTRPAGLVSLAGMTLPLHEKIAQQTRYLVELDGETTPEERAHLESTEQAVAAVRAALGATDPQERPGLFGVPFGFLVDLAAHDAAGETAATGLPILVLQGDRDYQVTLQDFALWEAALADRDDACLVSYEGLDHLFRKGTGPSRPTDYQQPGRFAEPVMNDIAAWIHNRTCP